MLSCFFKPNVAPDKEELFFIETDRILSELEMHIIRQVLADGFIAASVKMSTGFKSGTSTVTIGPRPNFATAFSNHLIRILALCGVPGIIRVERATRYRLPSGMSEMDFVAKHADRMTQCQYGDGMTSLAPRVDDEPEMIIDMLNEGPDALLRVPGVSMEREEREFYHAYFVGRHQRNPTMAEILDLYNANSDHSRHTLFRGIWIIDGTKMPFTLMQLIKETYDANPGNSVIAFADNSSAIAGFSVKVIEPERPGEFSYFGLSTAVLCPTLTAETHNFPTGVAPFPGAATGTGGRIRDNIATGRGAIMGMGLCGYGVGALCIPGYDLPWEDPSRPHPPTLARPFDILIQGSNGCAGYGNEIGEPTAGGWCRSGDQELPDGSRFCPLKPVLFTAGAGFTYEEHLQKHEAKPGMLIVMIGGPAYRVGLGGGASSSKLQGEQEAELDFTAVQRPDAQMQQGVVRVVKACVEMRGKNPIISIHDQGAGGPANVLKELVEKYGGKVNIRQVQVGDITMKVFEIWVAEYQERIGLLLKADDLEKFQKICTRESVNCEVLGEVTGDGRFVVVDERDGSTPVDFELSRVLGGMPIKTYLDETRDLGLQPLFLPDGLKVSRALKLVLRLLSVGSKRFLTNKKDRSVTGQIILQPCCGQHQATVADCAIMLSSLFDIPGMAVAIGEQMNMMLVDPKAAARRAVAEMITNLLSARITALRDVKLSANWMWAPKLPGEGAAMYAAAQALAEILMVIGAAIDGGKDSCSMATKLGEEIVKSCRQLVLTGYCGMEDARRHVTPDIKKPGISSLVHIDLGGGQYRLGGSALAQVFCQVGNDCPDVDPDELIRFAKAILSLHDQDLMCSYHDISDDGLMVAILEMAIAGACGVDIRINDETPLLNRLFAGEAGAVIEVAEGNLSQVLSLLECFKLRHSVIGQTSARRMVSVKYNGEEVLRNKLRRLWKMWEKTSTRIELLQANPDCVRQENGGFGRVPVAKTRIKFPLAQEIPTVPAGKRQPSVAILREAGSNGDREMTAAFIKAGFRAADVTMADILSGAVSLAEFQMLASVGGFSYADDPSSAKGWAATTCLNPGAKAELDGFFARPDTLSFHVCNGFQWATLCGLLPKPGIAEERQPRLGRNQSRRFESRWIRLVINESPAVMLRGMANSVLGAWVAHGEGRLIAKPDLVKELVKAGLAPLMYAGPGGKPTMRYPANPNGSPEAIAALCTADGRHLGMMPHPERPQAPYLEPDIQAMGLAALWPWRRMFINAFDWCLEHQQ